MWISLAEALDYVGHDRQEQLRLALRKGDIPARWFQTGDDVDRVCWEDPVRIDWTGSKLAMPTYNLYIIGDHCGVYGTDFAPAMARVEIDRGKLIECFPGPPRAQKPASKVGAKQKPPGETAGERRLGLLNQGISMERIAEWEGVDVDVVRRSISRGQERQKQRGQ